MLLRDQLCVTDWLKKLSVRGAVFISMILGNSELTVPPMALQF